MGGVILITFYLNYSKKGVTKGFTPLNRKSYSHWFEKFYMKLNQMVIVWGK